MWGEYHSSLCTQELVELNAVEVKDIPSRYSLEIEGWSSEECPEECSTSMAPEAELDMENIILSHQEIEEEFDCFSGPVSPQQTGSPLQQVQLTESCAGSTDDGNSGPMPIPSTGIGTGTTPETDPHSLTFLTSSMEASHTQVSTYRQCHASNVDTHSLTVLDRLCLFCVTSTVCVCWCVPWVTGVMSSAIGLWLREGR